MRVVRRLYQLRFSETFDPELTIRQIRGMEGARVRDSYARAARDSGIEWSGRSYKRDKWSNADPVNRALSAANSCLYGVCHAAIVSAGFSPALGFVHTGKMLSFVYDIADLYKAEITIPVAFQAAAEEGDGLERRVRLICRDLFASSRLLARIVPDIQSALMLTKRNSLEEDPFDLDLAAPGGLWDPTEGTVDGGLAYEVEPGEGEPIDGSLHS
jgi:CRISPR-associated protein Cas1